MMLLQPQVCKNLGDLGPQIEFRAGRPKMGDKTSAIERVTTIQLAMMRAGGSPQRGQHPKMNGCLNAIFKVRSDIPQALKIGLFRMAQDFEAALRFSSGA